MLPARVLHVYKHFRPQFTGEGVFLERLAPIFSRLRPDVSHEVLVTVTPRPVANFPPEALSKVTYLASGAAASQFELIAWLAYNTKRYGAIHFHTHVDRTFLGAVATKLGGCRLILSATLDDSIQGILRTYRPNFRPLVRRLIGIYDCFVAISPRLFEENTRFAPARKCALVTMGIPIRTISIEQRQAARKALGIDPSALVLVSVGGICARKDQMFLVRELPPLLANNPLLVLLLVGAPLAEDYVRSLTDFIEAQHLSRHVRLMGHVDDPWRFYAAADITVFASREEGFGTAMIEGMSVGLPLVARLLSGVNDSFIDNETSGFLYSEPGQYQSYMRALVSDPALRARIGAAARASVIGRFDIEDVARRYLSIYGYDPP